MARSPWRTGLWTALLVVAMGAFWFTVAPTVAGGRSAYVIVAGASMEPTLRRGDLVIARQAAAYSVGDIVTYRHPTVGPVIHRVVSEQDGKYTLQGDANTWTDSYHPAAGEVLGKAWIHLPAVGALLTWLRLPPMLALLALVISALVVSMVMPTREPAPSDERRSRIDTWLGSWAHSATTLQFSVFILGLLGLLGLLLAVPAWSRPLTRAADRVYPYVHTGVFNYTAKVPGEIYGNAALQTGQPAYLKLTQRVSVQFEYVFESDSPSSITGSAGLIAEVSDINGWKRVLVLQAPTPFDGPRAKVEGTLDLSVISGYLDDLEQRTGVTRPYYTLAVIPTVDVTGQLAGQPLDDEFVPALKFLIDDLQLQLAPQEPTPTAGDPLAPRRDAALETTEPAANRMTILGLSLTVRAARWISAVALAVGLGGLGLLGWGYTRALRRDPLVAIRLRYGAQLVAMRAESFELGGATLDVASLDDLARVADKHGRLIHWLACGPDYEFFVHTGEGLYTFCQAGGIQAAGEAKDAAPDNDDAEQEQI
jgi:signal peptidase I